MALWQAGVTWALAPPEDLPPTGSVGTLNAPALEASGDITLSWDGGGTLEETASIDGPWSASADQANPQTRTPSGTSFFRLVP
jgi:hypothetical protein